MRKKLVVLATVAVLVAVAFFVWSRRERKPKHVRRVDPGEVHASQIDRTDTNASLLAMLNAPDGATPCETAWNAISAEQAAARLRKTKSLFVWVAPKPEFLAGCQALEPDAQKCMAPRYRRDHDEECRKARPGPDALKKMLVATPEPD